MPGLIDYNQMAQQLLQQGGGLLGHEVAMKNPMQSKMLDPRGGTEGAVGYGGGANPLSPKAMQDIAYAREWRTISREVADPKAQSAASARASAAERRLRKLGIEWEAIHPEFVATGKYAR
jgi:hypothetical protein